MDAQTIQQSWEAYTKAWADISTTERKRLVQSSMSEDIKYSNPLIAGCGQAGILEVMSQFNSNIPERTSN